MNSIKIQILDENIKDPSQVFNHLVPVKRLDTQEEGTLLCSHCCRWPEKLKKQATWIEGCYSPVGEKDNPQLLLGYHPGTVTTWEVDLETRILTVKAEAVLQNNSIQVEAQYPLQVYHKDTTIPKAAYFRRQWKIASNGRELPQAVQAYYRSLDVGGRDKRVAWMFIDDPEFNTSDYGWQNTPREIGLEDYYDARVVTFNSSSGYGEAIPLDKSPYKIPLIDRDFFTGNLVVSEEAFFWPDSGFVPAIGIYEKRFYLREQMGIKPPVQGGKLPDQTKYIEVRENNLRCGYAKAIKL